MATHKLKTKTFDQLLGFYSEKSLETVYLYDLHIEQSAPESLPQLDRIIIISALLGSLIAGSYLKCALYQYMYDNHRDKSNSVIDLLILIDSLVMHTTAIMMVTIYTIGLALDITLSDHLGETFCNIPWYCAVFGLIYRTMGGLGIAILRLFYIKCPYQVRDHTNQKKRQILLLVIGILISATMAIGFGIGNGPASRKQVIWNFLSGKSETFREIVYNYSMNRGIIMINSDLIPKLVLLIQLTGIIAECVCYILFFKHLYSHDEDMLKKKRLPVGEVRKRHRTNAITFLGQFYGFVVECMITFILVYTMKGSSDIRYRMFLVIGYYVEFGVLTIVEVLTSQSLVRYLPHKRHFN